MNRCKYTEGCKNPAIYYVKEKSGVTGLWQSYWICEKEILSCIDILIYNKRDLCVTHIEKAMTESNNALR